MSINNIANSIRRSAKQNSSLIFSVGAGIGVVTTAYLSAKAGYHTAQKLSSEDPTMDVKDKARLVWRLYIPAGVSTVVTIGCIAGAKRVDGKKTLAAQTALAVTQQAYSEYREKIIDEFGEKKDQTVLAKVAEDRASDKSVPTIIAGSGTVLCFEMFTGRYFNSDMETLARAVNELNSRLLKHDYATLDDFYYLIGLEYTVASGSAGWTSDRLLELEYSSVLKDGRPCLAFDYNYVKSL